MNNNLQEKLTTVVGYDCCVCHCPRSYNVAKPHEILNFCEFCGSVLIPVYEVIDEETKQ